MKQGFFQNIKSFFNGKNDSNLTVENREQPARVIDFGGEEQHLRIKPEEDIYDNRYENVENYDLKELKLRRDDLFAGQTVVFVERKCIQFRVTNTSYQTVLVIQTDFKLILRDADWRGEFVLGQIERLNKYQDPENLFKILVLLKDGRKFKFRVLSEPSWRKFYESLQRFAFVRSKSHFFAFRHCAANRSVEETFRGWSLYDGVREFRRMGIKPMAHSESPFQDYSSPFKFLENKDGRICPTYPELLVVPSRISFDQIQRCAKFRSRSRLPALTYAYQHKPNEWSGMYRSSQSKVGVQKSRSAEDEKMLKLIGNPYEPLQFQKITQNCVIFDARSSFAAFGNRIAGKGSESQEDYPNCKVIFLNIPNIHVVRESYIKVQKAAHEEEANFFQGLINSSWYDYVFLILAGAVDIAKNMMSGINVLVHCSDGWDRTAQLCSLAAISLDPFYRTMEGFQILIEKDWIRFGHQFAIRMGQGMNAPTSDTKSQVFIQFLDCVSQLLHQYPSEFEFSQIYLQQIAQLAYSHLYGNFLCDSEQQMKAFKMHLRTVSLWSHLFEQKQTFRNPYYLPVRKTIEISAAQKYFRFWKEHFLQNIPSCRDFYQIYSCKFTQDNLALMYRHLATEEELLKEKSQEQQKIIFKLDQKIQNATKDMESNEVVLEEVSEGVSMVSQSDHPIGLVKEQINIAEDDG